jgi:HD-like signal output (HDOD) protein
MNPAAESMFSQAVRLPQIPHVMHEVVQSLRDENVSGQQLATLVSSDQVIVAKVLRLANSSYYGARRNVAKVSEAVQLLGLDVFRNLVISSALVSAFPKVSGFDLAAFWRNSMLVANIAHIIGREQETDREMLFSAGLMHSIGQLLIILCLPAESEAVADQLKNLDLAERRAAEERLLNLNHFEVGMELARRWNFPECIQSAVGHHDAPPADDLPAQIVHASVRIASGIQAGDTFADMLAAIPPEMAERLHIDQEWFMEEGEVFELLLAEASALA